MSEVKTLVNVYRAAYSNDKGTHREALVAGIAAVCRAVVAEAIAKHEKECHRLRPAVVKCDEDETVKPESASEAGDWADVTWTEARRLFTSTMKLNDSECAAIIREAAERHYGPTLKRFDNAITDLSLNLAHRTKDRDAARAECERLRAELLKLGASKNAAAPPSPAEDDLMAACETVSNRIHNAGCWSVAFVGEVVRAHIRPLFAAARAHATQSQLEHAKRLADQLDAMEKERDAVRAERDRLKSNVAAGVAEMRRYIEGNGFEWQPELSSVDNVTTAIGWLGGAVVTMKADRDKLAEELAIAVSAIAWADTHYCHVAANNRGVLAAYRATKGKEQGDGNA